MPNKTASLRVWMPGQWAVAVVALGGGRRAAADVIDPSVGLTSLAGVGNTVDADAPLAIVHARTEAEAEEAAVAVRKAYSIGSAADVIDRPSVVERIALTGK